MQQKKNQQWFIKLWYTDWTDVKYATLATYEMRKNCQLGESKWLIRSRNVARNLSPIKPVSIRHRTPGACHSHLFLVLFFDDHFSFNCIWFPFLKLLCLKQWDLLWLGPYKNITMTKTSLCNWNQDQPCNTDLATSLSCPCSSYFFVTLHPADFVFSHLICWQEDCQSYAKFVFTTIFL